jgi:WD40 repeat protein
MLATPMPRLLQILRTLRRPAVAVPCLLAIVAIIWLLFFRGPRLAREHQWTSRTTDLGPLLYTPDGKTLISAGHDPVCLWDPATGKLKLTLSTADAGAHKLAIAPAGDILACLRERRVPKQPPEYTLEIWNTATATRLATLEGENVAAIAFSPDGATVAVATATPTVGANTAAAATVGPAASVRLYSLSPVTPIATFPTRNFAGASLCFSPDGKRLACAQDHVIDLFDVATRRPLRTLKGPASGFVTVMQFSPDAGTLSALVAGQSPTPDSAWTWDLSTGNGRSRIQFDHPVRDASFSADRQTLAVRLLWYVFSRSERVEIWDMKTARKSCTLSPRAYVSSITLSPDARHLAVAFQSPDLKSPAPLSIWRID